MTIIRPYFGNPKVFSTISSCVSCLQVRKQFNSLIASRDTFALVIARTMIFTKRVRILMISYQFLKLTLNIPCHKYTLKIFPQFNYQCLIFKYCKRCKVRFHSAKNQQLQFKLVDNTCKYGLLGQRI